MKPITRMTALAGAALTLGVALLGSAAPALAISSRGTAATQTYTLNFNTPGLGTGSCTVSYYLGPDLASAPVLNSGVGLNVQARVSGSCTGNGAPDDVFVYNNSANGPGGTNCSSSNSYIGGFSSGAVSSTTSCNMTSYNGWYSASQTVDVDVSGGWTTQLTNSVPGCSQTISSGASCTWHPSYQNSTV